MKGKYLEEYKYEDGEWKSRSNRELEELSKGENIVKWRKGQRISWLGHLEKMEEDRSGSDAKEDDGGKTVYRMKERKTPFEMDG